MLYIDSNAGVGFSYNSTKLLDTDLNRDEATVDALYNALVNFFRTKFAPLHKNKFYIASNSYGGVVVPLLVRKILEHKKENGINLQGKKFPFNSLDSLRLQTLSLGFVDLHCSRHESDTYCYDCHHMLMHDG